MSILNDSNFVLLSIALFFIILIFITIKYKRTQTYTKLRSYQRKPIFYWKFLLELLNNNFDVLKMFSLLSHNVREKGFFSVNLIFKKWIFVFHPQYIEKLLLDFENIDRIFLSDALKGVQDDSLLVRNGDKWRERKEFVIPSFRRNVVNKYIPKFLIYSQQLMNNLKCKSNQWIDIFPLLKKFVFEVTLGTALSCNGIAEINFTEVTKLKKEITNGFMERLFNIFLWPDCIYQLTSKGKRDFKAKQSLKEIIRKVLDEKLEDHYNTDDCYESIKSLSPAELYAHALKTGNSAVTIESVISDLLLYADASHETIANALTWTLFELGKHPNIQINIQRELDELYKNGSIDNISTEQLNMMQYLECVIKESLRMHPPIPMTIRNSKREHRFGNEDFSKNSVYFILIHLLHQNSTQFPNPDIFDPNRFLQDNSIKRHPYSFIPFSCGPRKCLGKYYAMVQLKIFLAFIMKSFKIESFPVKCDSELKWIYLESKKPRLIRLSPRIF